jgi:hypothetical protein
MLQVFSLSMVTATLVYLVVLTARTSITDLAPAPNSTTAPGIHTVGAIINSTRPLQSAVLLIDGEPVETEIEAPSSRMWIVKYRSAFGASPHQVTMRVTDTSGSILERTWRFTASGPRAAPILTIAGPPFGEKIGPGPVRVAVQASSDAKIRSAVMTINGEEVPVTISPTPDLTKHPSVPERESVLISAEHKVTAGDYAVHAVVTNDRGEISDVDWRFTVVPSPADETARYFADTGYFVREPFKTFWETHRGAELFGNPVGPEAINQHGITVQYFERARLELAQDGSVGLGLLGREALRQQPSPVPNPGDPNIRYFAETGHTISGKFREFWEQNGGVEILGYPISEQMDEDGTRVQYFERVRLEIQIAEDGLNTVVEITPLGTWFTDGRR